MKNIILGIVGLLCIANIIYRIRKCATCDGDIFGIVVPGMVDIGFNTVVAIIIFGGLYKSLKA